MPGSCCSSTVMQNLASDSRLSHSYKIHSMSTILSHYEESFENVHCTNTDLSELWRVNMNVCWNIILWNFSACLHVQLKVLICCSPNSFGLWRFLKASFISDLFFIPSSTHSSKELVNSCCSRALTQYKPPVQQPLCCAPRESVPSAILSFSKILQLQPFNYFIKTTTHCPQLAELAWINLIKMAQYSDISDRCNRETQLINQVNI